MGQLKSSFSFSFILYNEIHMPDKAKIFIIEDDHFLSTLIKARLEKEGYTVTQAFDGEEAIELFKKNKPDLIILDLIMPRVSGFEVLENISVDPQFSRIPVIVLSNLGQESDIEKVKNLGAALHMIKVRTSIDDIVRGVKMLLGAPVGVGSR